MHCYLKSHVSGLTVFEIPVKKRAKYIELLCIVQVAVSPKVLHMVRHIFRLLKTSLGICRVK